MLCDLWQLLRLLLIMDQSLTIFYNMEKKVLVFGHRNIPSACMWILHALSSPSCSTSHMPFSDLSISIWTLKGLPNLSSLSLNCQRTFTENTYIHTCWIFVAWSSSYLTSFSLFLPQASCHMKLNNFQLTYFYILTTTSRHIL